MLKDQDTQPVIWALGRFGTFFQMPILKALSLESRPLAVASRRSALDDFGALPGAVLAAPRTITGARSAIPFALGMRGDRQTLARRLRERAQLVHVTMISPWDAWYLKAARMAGVPSLVTIHDATRHPGEESGVLDRVAQMVLGHADHVVTLSQHVYAEFQANAHFNRPLHLLEGGLLVRTEPELPARAAPGDRPLKILFSGRIRHYKGLHLLLEALELLQARGRHCEVTVAGSGDMEPYADALARLPHVAVINRWISDEELCRLLSDHDVMALPYIEASQSAVALDAQWAAMPVLSTPVGGLKEQLSHGVDSLIAAEATGPAFADVMERLLRDPVLYETLSRGAHAAFQQVSLRPVGQKWRALYDEILAG